MATLLTLLDDLRDALGDAADTKYPKARKIRYLNRGQRAMFPKIHRVVRDITTVLVADTFEYDLPAAVIEGKVLGVEVETADDSSRWVQLDGRQFNLVPGGVNDVILQLIGPQLPSEAGSAIRFTCALPLTDLAADGDTYTGPAVSEELPFLYAMGLAISRDFETRIQFQRFSTTQALNGVTPEDLSLTADFWFKQFQTLLDQVAMPLATP